MKKISEIKIPAIENIFHKAKWLNSIQENIAVFIPEELRAHCSVVNFEHGILVFAVENSAWALKFRYITADLLKQLRTQLNLHSLSAIKYYVEPEFLKLFKGV